MPAQPPLLALAPGEHPDDLIADDEFAWGPKSSTSRLSLAILAKNLPLATQLIAAGANPDLGSAHDMTPLMYAALHGHKEGMDLLLASGADCALADQARRTALTLAAGADRVDLVKTLAAAGADVDHLDRRGVTPLMAALDEKRLDMAHALIQLGANPEATTSIGATMRAYLAERKVSADIIHWMETAAEARDLSVAIQAAPKDARKPSI